MLVSYVYSLYLCIVIRTRFGCERACVISTQPEPHVESNIRTSTLHLTYRCADHLLNWQTPTQF